MTPYGVMAPLPAAPHVLDEYLDHTPMARHAALHDAEGAADVHRLRTTLGHRDTALGAEGLPTVARLRV